MNKQKRRFEEKKSFILAAVLVSLTLVVLFGFVPIANAESDEYDEEEITKEDAEEAIENMETIMKEMQEEGFNVLRVNDTISTARDIFTAQSVEEREGGKPDYSQVVRYEGVIEGIRDDAVESRDDLYTLQEEAEALEEEGMNISSALKIIERIEQEVEDERYEKAIELTPRAFRELSDIEAEFTAARVFYKATRGILAGFWEDNWETVIIVIITAVFLYFAFRKRIKKLFIQRKLNGLELRRKSLKNLTQKTQKAYFEEGTIPEEIYNIRTTKFSELVRDIDRQTPMLREAISRLEGKKTEDDKKKEGKRNKKREEGFINMGKKEKGKKTGKKEKAKMSKKDEKKSKNKKGEKRKKDKKEKKRGKEERRKAKKDRKKKEREKKKNVKEAERKVRKEVKKEKKKSKKKARKDLFDKLSKGFKGKK